MLDGLRRLVPFDAAWLALADPMRSGYGSLASADLDEGIGQYLSGPQNAHDIEVTQANRARPPMSPSDLPYPVSDLPTWADCLLPAGFHEALVVALFDRGQRPVGYLALLPRSRQPPSRVVRRRLHRLAPLLARGIDPLRSLAAAARVVRGAAAGAVLCCDGATGRLPGLDGDALLAEGSPVLAIARSYIDDGQVYASFLWPRGGRHAPDGHVRVTVLASPDGASAGLLGTVVLPRDRPPGADAAGAGGARVADRRVFEPADRPDAGRGPAHRRGAPGAHPRQARCAHEDPRRRAGRARRALRAPVAVTLPGMR
jgi:hypothetical protein